jgi:hypothetical protein
MNIPSAPNTTTILPSANISAAEGIRTQEQRFERNVAEVSRNEPTQTRESSSNEATQTSDSSSRDSALVEQGEILQAVQANVRSLEVSNQRVGTLVDIEA